MKVRTRTVRRKDFRPQNAIQQRIYSLRQAAEELGYSTGNAWGPAIKIQAYYDQLRTQGINVPGMSVAGRSHPKPDDEIEVMDGDPGFFWSRSWGCLSHNLEFIGRKIAMGPGDLGSLLCENWDESRGQCANWSMYHPFNDTDVVEFLSRSRDEFCSCCGLNFVNPERDAVSIRALPADEHTLVVHASRGAHTPRMQKDNMQVLKEIVKTGRGIEIPWYVCASCRDPNLPNWEPESWFEGMSLRFGSSGPMKLLYQSFERQWCRYGHRWRIVSASL